MSVTNAISSVIIVGAIIAALAISSDSGFDKSSSIFGFLAIILAAINIFGGFLVTQRMLQMYKKKKIKNNDIFKFISNILFSFRNIIYFCFKRFIIARHIKTRKLFWYCWNDNSNNSNFFINRKFF